MENFTSPSGLTIIVGKQGRSADQYLLVLNTLDQFVVNMYGTSLRDRTDPFSIENEHPSCRGPCHPRLK